MKERQCGGAQVTYRTSDLPLGQALRRRGFLTSGLALRPFCETTNLPTFALFVSTSVCGSSAVVTLFGLEQVADDGTAISAHRIVLAARCEPLHAMLSSGMKEDGAPAVQLHFSVPVIRALLQFLCVQFTRARSTR